MKGKKPTTHTSDAGQITNHLHQQTNSQPEQQLLWKVFPQFYCWAWH